MSGDTKDGRVPILYPTQRSKGLNIFSQLSRLQHTFKSSFNEVYDSFVFTPSDWWSKIETGEGLIDVSDCDLPWTEERV